METLDLFQLGKDQWVADPMASFDTWLSHQKGRGVSTRFKLSSAEVYRAQWGKFVTFIKGRGVNLIEATEVDIIQFLASLSTENRSQRDRYRKLIERALDDLNRNFEIPGYVNPALLAKRQPDSGWKDVDGNLPTSFLSHENRDRIWSYLSSSISFSSSSAAYWKAVRDRAMVGLYLGGGLKASEVLRLTVNCIELDGGCCIQLPKPDSAYLHKVTLQPLAKKMLIDWLDFRQSEGFLGDLIFAADRSGKPMHPVTGQRNTENILSAAGVLDTAGARISPQTLRNTFAAELFERGASDEEICEAMGFAVLISVDRLRMAWDSWRCFYLNTLT